MSESIDELRAKAEHSLRLAEGVGDQKTVAALRKMAADYLARGEALEAQKRETKM